MSASAEVLRSVFRHRFQTKRIESLDELAEFVATRSAYIGQTSLYGYLKTRMGTQFRLYFEDKEFSASIHRAAMNIYVSCLMDLTVYSIALIVKETGLEPQRANGLARKLFAEALMTAVKDRDLEMVPSDSVAKFDERIAKTIWESAVQRENAFGGSINGLIEFAPVVDEFKELDREIVQNSIRFRWRDVREQLRKRLAAEELARFA